MVSKGFVLAGVSLALMACTNLQRSRDIGNPQVSGATLAQQVCSDCHGLSGNSINPNFPKLAQQQPEYVINQLTAFRAHQRLDPAGFEYMWGLSRKLSDAQIKQLADYYASQERVGGTASVDAAAIARGRQIFHDGIPESSVPACQSCHGANGLGAANIPMIARQHGDYIIKQLSVFQRTDERPEGVVMKAVAHGLSSVDMHAVASYLESMPAQTAAK